MTEDAAVCAVRADAGFAALLAVDAVRAGAADRDAVPLSAAAVARLAVLAEPPSVEIVGLETLPTDRRVLSLADERVAVGFVPLSETGAVRAAEAGLAAPLALDVVRAETAGFAPLLAEGAVRAEAGFAALFDAADVRVVFSPLALSDGLMFLLSAKINSPIIN